jgi:predicted transcriptional regulator
MTKPTNTAFVDKNMIGTYAPKVKTNAAPLDARVAKASGIGYTSGMKTAISIPDPIFREAERLARRLKKSRSQLYAEAMADYLRRHDADAVTEALNRVYAESGERIDPFADAAARRLLSNVEW